MQDVIDLLQENSIDIPVPLELPDDDDLIVIEEELLLPLPYEYKEFLLTVSDVVYGSFEPATASDACSHTHLPELASQAWDLGISRELIPICKHRGNYYCLQQDGSIQFYENLQATEEEWSSIWHWAKDVWLES